MSTPEALSSSRLVQMSTDLPEVVLREGVSWANITFRGRGFAWVNHPENRAMIKARHDERDAREPADGEERVESVHLHPADGTPAQLSKEAAERWRSVGGPA